MIDRMHLTSQQNKILDLYIQGLEDWEIAEQLDIEESVIADIIDRLDQMGLLD